MELVAPPCEVRFREAAEEGKANEEEVLEPLVGGLVANLKYSIAFFTSALRLRTATSALIRVCRLSPLPSGITRVQETPWSLVLELEKAPHLVHW